MRKFCILLLFILLSKNTVFASYIGNPADPLLMSSGLFSGNNPWYKIVSGYVMDQSTEKHMVFASDDPNFENIERVNSFSVESNWGNLALILVQRLELYIQVGTSQEKIKWTSPPMPGFNSGNLGLSAKSDSHFSMNTGAKVILLEFARTLIGVDFHFFRINAPGKFSYILDRLNYPFNFGPQYLILRETELSLGIARRIGFILTPYVGVSYLKTRLKIKADGVKESLYFKNQKKWGTYFGGSINLTSKFNFSAEGRFGNETAYSFSANTAF